jgi:plastocyanin
VSRSRLLLAAVCAAALGCGGGDGSGGGGGQTCTPGNSFAITITATGMSPQNACVLPNGTVTFTNNDSVQHDIEIQGSGCPRSPGGIQPGASASATFTTVQNCPYSDATKAGNTAFTGTIAVSQETQTGGGY